MILYQLQNWLQSWLPRPCIWVIHTHYPSAQLHLVYSVVITWIHGEFHAIVQREVCEWRYKRNYYWFSYESHSFEFQLANQVCNSVRRVTQTLQLILIIIIVESLWITLGRVTKTLQPSPIWSHTLSHYD
jgi:hypothetical protein